MQYRATSRPWQNAVFIQCIYIGLRILWKKKLSVCSPSCGMKERQHSIIEGDIRFSHEELVKVISITDYLVAKLRARAITHITDEQCTTVSPYADWIISFPWGISEQTEARKLVSKAPLTTLSKQLFHKRKKSSTLSFSRSRWSRIQISLPIIVQQFSLIEFRESGFNQVIFFILLLTCILENVYVVIFWGKIPIRSFLGI